VWQELRLGMTVHVYGRELLVLDCDEFTRSWYMQNEGLSSAQLQPVQVDFDLAPRAPTPEVRLQQPPVRMLLPWWPWCLLHADDQAWPPLLLVHTAYISHPFALHVGGRVSMQQVSMPTC
jgi:hypothetical protein